MPSKQGSTDYLYDFIYADTRRIYSYLSQIDPSGVVTAIKEVVSESDSHDTQGQFSVKVVRAVVKGATSNSQSLEHQFDATPTLPWALLNRLDEMGYLGDDLRATPVGRLVHIKGTLSLVDVRLLREAWRPLTELWFIENEQALQSAARDCKPNSDAARAAKAQINQLNDKIRHERASTDLIEKLPHTVNMTFSSEQANCWSAISPANFLFDPEDLILKHGPHVSGVWHMVAIVDASPSPNGEDPGMFLGGDFHALTTHVTRSLQYRFGRPPGHYAVTPIAIYRAVERPT